MIEDGWTITPGHARALASDDPLFTPNDGADCPPTSATQRPHKALSSEVVDYGLIRIELAIPGSANFSLVSATNPERCAIAPGSAGAGNQLFLFRRPLPSTNLVFDATIMWDGRETLQKVTNAAGFQNEAPWLFDLNDQANAATLGHAQGAAIVGTEAQSDIVAFETDLYSAQSNAEFRQPLDVDGAHGGPQYLASTVAPAFAVGVNDPLQPGFTNADFSGAGGQAGAGAAGASGGSGHGGAGSVSGAAGSGTGAGGSSSSGAGGSGTGTGGAGAGGSAGTTGAGGSAGASGATDAGLSGDAAASLCKTFGLNLPFGSVSNVDAGIAPDSSAYTGGTIASGRYYLTAVTHYGAGSYSGSRQAQYTFDATAKTIVIGEFVPTVGGSQYGGMTYTKINANTLRATVVCNSGTAPTGTFDLYYTVNGSQITLTTVGSNDVSVL